MLGNFKEMLSRSKAAKKLFLGQHIGLRLRLAHRSAHSQYQVPSRLETRGSGTLLESVVNNHEPVVVTRPDGANVVVLSWEDRTGMEETAYLLRSPAL